MKVFIDTEFTDFQHPRLISIALVTEDGERSFYAELTDNYTQDDCSYFVLETVLPLLDAPELPVEIDYKRVYARMTVDQCRHHLNAWFAAIQEPVKVVSDSDYDQDFLRALLNDDWPAMLDREPHYVAFGECGWLRYSARTDQYFAKHPKMRRHHALDDARVMRTVVLQIEATEI